MLKGSASSLYASVPRQEVAVVVPSNYRIAFFPLNM